MSGATTGATGASSPPVDLPAPPAVDATAVKACCADLWAHPAVQLLAGEALHPGGLDLTARVLDHLDLAPGAPVLDVGCGAGVTLELLARRGQRPVGVDYSPSLTADAGARASAVVGDAEALPCRDGAFDAVVMECVLSAFPDKPAALAQARRVLRPGGWLALTDVTVAGSFPEPLRSLLTWAACAAGALPREGYVGLLAAHDLEVTWVEDQDAAVRGLLAQVRRRLALLRGALGTGILPDLDGVLGRQLAELVPGLEHTDGDALAELAQQLLGQVSDSVERGELGYTALVARRPAGV